jgi:hypothetical protein
MGLKKKNLHFPLLCNDSISIRTVLSVALDERIVNGYGAEAGTELLREAEVLASLPFCPPLVPRDLGMNLGRRGGRTANSRLSYGRSYRKFSDGGSDRTQNLARALIITLHLCPYMCFNTFLLLFLVV